MANGKDLKAVTDIIDDDTIYDTADVVAPAGGAIKKRKADVNKTVDAKADTVKEEAVKEEADEEEDSIEEVSESFADLFEGTDLSEDFKEKAQLVFEAAVNEAARAKAIKIAESLEEEFETNLNESVTESMDAIIENLDAYLDYIVAEWMEENEVAIESGVKVEMAESFMEGLMSLFSEHRIEIDEETVDVVNELEGKLSESNQSQNTLMHKNIELSEEIAALKAEKVFNAVCEDLTTSQKERMKILSEKLDNDDIDAFKNDLETLKESFFKKETPVISEEFAEEEEILTEDTNFKQRVSEYDSVNAIVAAINAKNKK